MRKTNRVKAACFLLAALPLAGCLSATEPSQPAMYDRLNRSDKMVNPMEAVGMINSYRLNKGLSPVTLDSKLTAAAKIQARAMAEADQVSHALKPSLTLAKRLTQTGYQQTKAVENISAGYWTLAEAFSGWRDSKLHNANMLDKDVAQLGIATQFKPNAKYQVFWSLILAKPKQVPLTKPKTKASPKKALSAQEDRPNHKTDSLAEIFAN